MALIFARNFSSGANLLSSQAPNESASSAVTTLKSRQPPHTMRCTLLTPLTPFTYGSCRYHRKACIWTPTTSGTSKVSSNGDFYSSKRSFCRSVLAYLQALSHDCLKRTSERMLASSSWALTSEALSESADHLHRHSRAMVSNETFGVISA